MTERPVVLFRSTLAEAEELQACAQYFPVISLRSQVSKGDLVIPRYSALPYYREFEQDVIAAGGRLINTHHQHTYVADMQNWYADLYEYTPKTWFALDHLPEKGPFVLKGHTNSKKHNWNTHMYAETRAEAIAVHSRLCMDGLIGSQDICVRQYVPIRKFGDGIKGLPITEEYRTFVLNGEIVSSAFYWSEHTEYLIEECGFTPDPASIPVDFLYEVIRIVSPHIPFFVVDVGRLEDGSWIVVELNDGQMSGLSDNDPDILYYNMSKILIQP